MYYGKRLREIADTLRQIVGIPEQLAGIRENVDDHTKTIRSAEERKRQRDKIRQEWLNEILADYKRTELDKTSNDKRNYRVQNSLRWATWLAFAAAAVYAAIAAYQLNTSNKQLTAMNRTYSQIEKQTALMRQQIVGSEAAAVRAETTPQAFFDRSELLNWITLGINFTNFGKVATGKFIAEATLTRQGLPGYKPISVLDREQLHVPRIMPDLQTGPAGVGRDIAHLAFHTALTQKDMEQLLASKEALEVAGYFEYDNGFGDTMHQPFCYLYMVSPSTIIQQGDLSVRGWVSCDEGKPRMSLALKWKNERPKSDPSH
jgi:hypothetical protein